MLDKTEKACHDRPKCIKFVRIILNLNWHVLKTESGVSKGLPT